MTPLEKLTKEYKELLRIQKFANTGFLTAVTNYYKGMKEFCISCCILSREEINEMERNLNE